MITLYSKIDDGILEGKGITHLKFNITPEKLPSQKESNLPTSFFRGYLKLRGCRFNSLTWILGFHGFLTWHLSCKM